MWASRRRRVVQLGERKKVIDACVAAARAVNPEIEALRVSATTGEGLETWYGWLESERAGLDGAKLSAP